MLLRRIIDPSQDVHFALSVDKQLAHGLEQSVQIFPGVNLYPDEESQTVQSFAVEHVEHPVMQAAQTLLVVSWKNPEEQLASQVLVALLKYFPLAHEVHVVIVWAQVKH